MPYRKSIMACILMFACGVLICSFVYGPQRRTYASPPRVVTVDHDADIYRLWQSAGIRGRIVILLTPNLSMQVGMNTSNEYLELALRHGIVRTAYQVVPDSAWQQVYAANLERKMPTPPRVSNSSFSLLLEAGRITVVPFSRFWPVNEKVLVVMEPAPWSSDERGRIVKLLQSGELATDCIAIVNGSPLDRQQLAEAIHVP